MLQLVKIVCLLIILFTGLFIFIKSADYYYPDFSRGYLSDKKNVFDGLFHYAFYAHIVSAPVALFIGTYQAWVRPVKPNTSIHILLGKIYTALVLFLAAPGGLVLSFYALGGLSGKISFFLLSIFWLVFTWSGYVLARKREIAQHQRYMIRSYVLLLSAIILRLLLFFCSHYFDLTGEKTYGIVAWLSWVPTLIIAEFYFIYRGRRKTTF